MTARGRLSIALALASTLFGREAAGLPAGKAWAATTQFSLPGYVSFSVPRLEFDGTTLRVDTEPRGTARPAAVGLRWSDSVWVERWRLPYPTYLFGPVATLDGEAHLVWLGDTDPNWIRPPLMMSRWVGDDIAPIDTVTRTMGIRTEYGACASKTRRWVVVCDRIPDSSGEYEQLRLFYSDKGPAEAIDHSLRPNVQTFDEGVLERSGWHEVRGPVGGNDGVAIAPLGDSTAIVVWASGSRHLDWGLLEGSRWVPRGALPDKGWPVRPRMRTRADGGIWLSWGATDQDVRLASFQNGEWSGPQRISGNYPRDPQSQNFVADTEMSRDSESRPVVAWDASYFASSQILVAFPTLDGYSIGELVPGSFDGVLPSIVRDQYGDVWVTWWEAYRASWWAHTYTHAIASDLRIEDHGRNRTLTWTLNMAAPGSCWTVLRSRNGLRAESVAQVRASEATTLAWRDDNPPAGHLTYRVRRDCLDTRYVWTSPEVVWPDIARGHRDNPEVEIVQNLARKDLPVELSGVSPGQARLMLFDLQGRLAFDRMIEFRPGSGSFELPSQSLPVQSGVYFARLRDPQGRASALARILVLK